MGRWRKVLDLMRISPANARFSDLCGLVVHVGFELRRQAGSHRIYRHPRPEIPMVNLQQGSGGKAKPYQVRQVITIIDEHGLEVD